MKLTITLNNRTYSWTDTSSSEQPSKIDVLAVHMRNHRPYSRLVLGKLCNMAADFDGSGTVDTKDLYRLAKWWLLPCPYLGNCEGADINKDRKVNPRDLSLFAGDWLKSCSGH